MHTFCIFLFVTQMDNSNDEWFVNLEDDNDVNSSDTNSSNGSDAEVDIDVDNEEGVEDVDNEEEAKDVDCIGFKFKNLKDVTTDDITPIEFSCEHNAYKFYIAYTKSHGFGIRKDYVDYDMNHNIIMCQFVCIKKGLRDKKFDEGQQERVSLISYSYKLQS